MNEPHSNLPVDTTVNDAVTFLTEAVADLPSGPDMVRTVKAELERLRTNNTRLGLLRIDAEAKVDAARALHVNAGGGLGYTSGGGYGDYATACSSCGTADEYAVEWPCPTRVALDGE